MGIDSLIDNSATNVGLEGGRDRVAGALHLVAKVLCGRLLRVGLPFANCEHAFPLTGHHTP